jgi:hypothetical protein
VTATLWIAFRVLAFLIIVLVITIYFPPKTTPDNSESGRCIPAKHKIGGNVARTCGCPNPPGGSITCSDDQLAMCGYQDGQIISGCFDPPFLRAVIPIRSLRIIALNNWILQRITGEYRFFIQGITAQEYDVLRSGEYVNARGERLTFVVPAELSSTETGGASVAATR